MSKQFSTAMDNATAETAENRRRSIRNFFTKNTEDLQPYDNKAQLEIVSLIKEVLRGKETKMISDLKAIFWLISECIQLYHPITLDIRYQFCKTLSYFFSLGDCYSSREKWEQLITSGDENGGYYEHTLEDFIKTVLEDKKFRKNIIATLEYERDKLLNFPIDKENYDARR